MKFAIAKSYPHPVLRIGSSDYIDAEFEMEFSVERMQTTTAIEINVKFDSFNRPISSATN